MLRGADVSFHVNLYHKCKYRLLFKWSFHMICSYLELHLRCPGQGWGHLHQFAMGLSSEFAYSKIC